MTEKYFTPEIEDLRVGFEGEYRVGSAYEWQKFKIFDLHTDRDGYGIYEYVEYLNEGLLRVPYLTKEQIEAEGWIPITEGNIDQWYRDDKHLALKLYYNLGPKQDKIIIRIWQEISHGNQLFLGECKCINTFRYICKLIGI